MGQSVSTDAKSTQLQELLGDGSAPSALSARTASLAGIAAHHVMAWKFVGEGNNESFRFAPLQLADSQGRLTVELQASASYLILHVEAATSSAQEPPTEVAMAAFGGIAARASAVCSPRGLGNKLSQGSTGGSSSFMNYAVFVWHGHGVDPMVKAQAFVKAFELDRRLQAGLLWQKAFLEGLEQAVRYSGVADSFLLSEQNLGEENHSTNRLIDTLSKGGRSAIPGSKSITSSWCKLRAKRQTTNASESRFPFLSQWVWESLGVRTTKTPLATSQQARQGRPPVLPRLALNELRQSPSPARQSPSREYSPRLHHSPQQQHSPRQHSPQQQHSSRQQPSPVQRPPVPRLALSNLHSALAEVKLAAEGSPQQWPARSPRRPSPSMGTSNLSCNPGALDAAHGARPRGVSSSPQGSRSPPRMSTHAMDPMSSPRGAPPVSLSLDAEVLASPRRRRDEDVPDVIGIPTERRHLFRPSELRQIELQRYQGACSEVVPDAIFVSGYMAASDLGNLRRHKITHILNLAADICENQFPDLFSYSTYYIKDVSNEDISVFFYRALEWMQGAVSSGGRVLVHCREGISRSATVAIAYLMWRFQLSFAEAYDRIRKVRPICNPNPGFTYHLLELGKRLGTGGVIRQTSEPRLFRVRPHHPKNPVLLLAPAESPPSLPVFDPRFGWVVQSGQQLVVWIGSQVPDKVAVRSAAYQHAQLAEKFERCKYTLTAMHEGSETLLLWQALQLPSTPESQGVPALAAVRESFDADYEVLKALAEVGATEAAK